MANPTGSPLRVSPDALRTAKAILSGKDQSWKSPVITLTISREGSMWHATASAKVGPGKDEIVHVTSSISHHQLLKLWRQYKNNDSTSGLFDSLSDMVSSIPGVKAVTGIVNTIAKTVPIGKLIAPVLKIAKGVSETAIRSAYALASKARLGIKSALDKVGKLKDMALNNPLAKTAFKVVGAVLPFVPKLAVNTVNAGFGAVQHGANTVTTYATDAAHGAIKRGRTVLGAPAAVLEGIKSGSTPRTVKGFSRGLALLPPLMSV